MKQSHDSHTNGNPGVSGEQCSPAEVSAGPVVLIPVPRARVLWGPILPYANFRWTLVVVLFGMVVAVEVFVQRAAQLYVLGVIPVALLGTVVGVVLHRRKHRADFPVSTLPPCEDDSHQRLVCRGHPRDLHQVAEVNAEAFEPYIVTPGFKIGAKMLWVVPLMVVGMLIVRPGIQRMCVQFAFPLFPLFATDVMRILRPSYYRIVPGQLEILEYNWFARGDPSIERIALRESRIECDFGRTELKISSECETTKTITLQGITDPHEFVRMIFRGAICPAVTPRLPTNELLG